MLDIVVVVAAKVAEYLVAPVGRQCGYVIFSDSHVRQLKDEVEELGAARERVQHSIDEARNNMKRIEADVERWMKNVGSVANKARDVLDYDRRAKKTCFYGWLPNPMARYRLSKEMSKTVKDIKALIERGQFQKVDFENPPPGLVCSAPDVNASAVDGGDTITDSRASIFQGILKALDDEELKVIGVYGPSGVGKTTLLKEVKKKLKDKGRPFHTIVKVEVSQIPDLNNIRDQIADALSLDLKDKQSPQGKGDVLSERLKSDPDEKVLMIFDNLRAKLDLEAVGIPWGDVSSKCKLLLTSRFKDVLEQDMGADRTFLLQGLKDDEAFRLFENKVGDKLKDNEELKSIADQVVKKLAGLPLLIISVASTLKSSNESAWRNALIEIDESNKEKKETIVTLSYDHLKSEDAKYLFLLCGLIGGTIRVELLFVLAMGLGLFERFNKTMQDSRDRLNNTLNELRSACLLLDGGNDKDSVTIHDLYSEVVVSILSRDQNSLVMNNNNYSSSKKTLEKCWAICLDDVGTDRLAELMLCQFPSLKILMLSMPKVGGWRQEHRHDVDDCSGLLDFTYMKELQVLYLCSMHVTNLPPSIEILGNLRSLYLDHCNMEDVAIIGKLKALQILNFRGSTISRLPKEIGDLTNLRSLNLSNCKKLKIIESGALKGLINLEELHMKESFDQWMGMDDIQLESCNSRLAELKSLTKLTSLEISIRDPNVLLEDDDLPFGNLISFWINIGDTWTWMREYEGLRTMKLQLEWYETILLRECVKKALQNTQYLLLGGMRESKKNARELCIGGFPRLKHLQIESSPSIKYITNSSGAFPNLESLSLSNLINLEKIYHGCVASECLSKLKIVNVFECDQLKYLWCLSQMQGPIQLEEIAVKDCNSMQAIFTSDAGKDVGSTNNIVELSNVRCLNLRRLPSMMSFCTTTGITSEDAPLQVSFPHLESLTMDGLLDLDKILYSQPPLEYSNLKSIRIRRSQSTSSILKSDWIMMLPNLELLAIKSSQSPKVVFELKELKVTGHVEILSQLKKLTLTELPNLQYMWKQDVQLQEISVFRNLKKLMVSKTGLAFLFPVSVAKCLREIRDIEVEDCPNMRAIIVDEEGRDEGTNDIIEFPLLKRLHINECAMEKFFSCPSRKKDSITTTSDSQDAYFDSFFNRKVSLPSLEELILQSLPSLKRIWHGGLPRSSFDKFAYLCLEECSDLLDVFPSTIIKRLHNLKGVKVSNCPSLKSLFDCGSLDSNTEQTRTVLPNLVDVEILECPSLESLFDCGSLDSNMELSLLTHDEVKVGRVGRLRHVVKSDCQTILGFPSLTKVKVENCSKLRYLFPNYMATTLEKLEKLFIEHCEEMKEVVPKEEGGRSKANVLRFPCLIHLRIAGCCNFGAFIPSPTSAERPLGETTGEDDESPQPLFNEMATFPNLRELEIEDAECKELWNNQIPIDSFCKLESLKLKDCDNLQRIAPCHVWKRLQRCLKILEVTSCHSIEIIYESDGTDTKNGKLRALQLCHLENLRHIWRYSDLQNIPFPNLRSIAVILCPHLEILLPTFTAEFLGQIEMVGVWSCENMEIIASHGECEEATDTIITFSKLTTLYLDNLPKLRSYLPEKYTAEFPSLKRSSVARWGAKPDDQGRNWWHICPDSQDFLREVEFYRDLGAWSGREGDEGEDLGNRSESEGDEGED